MLLEVLDWHLFAEAESFRALSCANYAFYIAIKLPGIQKRKMLPLLSSYERGVSECELVSLMWLLVCIGSTPIFL
jgi:hypothetical protein